jgi:hypothetical protein
VWQAHHCLSEPATNAAPPRPDRGYRRPAYFPFPGTGHSICARRSDSGTEEAAANPSMAVVPLMGIQYRLARWSYGTKGLKRLRVGTAGRGKWHVADYREYPLSNIGSQGCLKCGKELISWNGHRERRNNPGSPTPGRPASRGLRCRYSRSLYGSGGGCVDGALAGCLGPASDRCTSPSSAWLSMLNNVTLRLPHARHLNGRP